MVQVPAEFNPWKAKDFLPVKPSEYEKLSEAGKAKAFVPEGITKKKKKSSSSKRRAREREAQEAAKATEEARKKAEIQEQIRKRKLEKIKILAEKTQAEAEKQRKLQQQLILLARQRQQTFPTTKIDVRDIGVSVGEGLRPLPTDLKKDDRVVVYDTETGTAYLSDEPVTKTKLPQRLQRRAEEARDEEKFFKGQLLSTGAFVTSYATTLASIPKDTVSFLLSPIDSTKGLIEYVKSGGMKQDITLGLAGGGEVLLGKVAGYATAPKVFGKAIPKKVSKAFSKKARQFKQLSEAEPTVSVGYKRTKGNVQELTVETGRATKDLESITSTKYKIEKVGDSFQISKGKGTTKIEKVSGKNKGVILEQDFTFAGEAQPAKVTRVKSYKKSYLDDPILIQKQPLQKGVSPTRGRIEILTKGESPKLTKQSFFGVSKKIGKVDAGLGFKLEQTGYKVFDTGIKGITSRTRLKGIARPEAKSLSFIAELPQRIKPTETFGYTRFKPKTGRLTTSRPEVIKVVSEPKPSSTGLVSKQIVKAETKVPEIVTQAVERQAVKSLIRTRPVTSPLIPEVRQSPIQKSKAQFKGTIQSESFALGQTSALKADLTQTQNPLFDAVQDVSVRQVTTPTQTTSQLLTPRMAQPTKLLERTKTTHPSPTISAPTPPLMKLPKQKKLVSGQGYNVSVKRYSTDKNKMVWEKVNPKPLTKDSALSLGAMTTDKDISASFKYKKAPVEYEKTKKGEKKIKKKIIELDTEYYDNNKEKFREYKIRKGKKMVTTGRFIEKAKYRLDSPSERKQIAQAPRGRMFAPGETPMNTNTRVQSRRRSIPLMGFNEVSNLPQQTFREEAPQQTGLSKLGSGMNQVSNTFNKFNGALAKTGDRMKVNLNPRNRKQTNQKQQASIFKRR